MELIHRIERVIVHLKIPTAKCFEALLAPARYKGVFGGRGSGKSHFFGELLVETCQAERGTLAVCIREAQRTLAQSSKLLIESKIATLGLGHQFRIFSDKIETPGDGLIIFRGMQYDAGKYRLMMKAKDPHARRAGTHGSAYAQRQAFELRQYQGRGGALSRQEIQPALNWAGQQTEPSRSYRCDGNN